MSYLTLKTLHILCSTVLFGTGLGTAFFMWITNRRKNIEAIRVTTKNVILADILFTTPAVILQPLTGFILVEKAGFSISVEPMNWLGLALVLYCLAGACWIPVLWIQWKMHQISLTTSDSLPKEYWKLEKIWTLLGIIAFISLIMVYFLMVFKTV